MKERKIELAGLRFSSNRNYGGEGEIKILAEDIKRNGLINPITVKQTPEEVDDGVRCDDIYTVVAGRRRVLAVTMLGWKDIPCRILEGDEVDRSEEIAGSENINRLAMHPLDEANVFSQLLANGRTIEELAKQYDRKTSEILQRIQLLDLNEDVKAMFKNGHITLLSAALLKNLNEDGQKAFYKQYKSHWEIKEGGVIEDRYVKSFISNLDHDRLYSFLRDKQCAECKTRTFFSDKNLFPELNDLSENCFNHKCYLQKWETVLASRIKSLKGENKTHSESCIISSDDQQFLKIAGKKLTLDGIEFTVLHCGWQNRANAKDNGARPCFSVDITGSGKLEVSRGYWKEPEKESRGSHIPAATKRRDIAPIVSLLDLPKDELNETLDVMSNSKRISPYTFGHNVSESVFWRVIEIKAQEFNDPKKTDQNCRELFLKKYLSNIQGSDRKIFDAFAGKMSIPEIAKMPPEKIFSLLCAMEQSAWDMLSPDDLSKGKKTDSDILKWVGLPPDKLKQLFQDEIRKRIPKKKPEPKKPAEKKQAKAAEKPVVKKSAKAKPAAKKPVAKKPAQAKKKAPAKGKAKK